MLEGDDRRRMKRAGVELIYARGRAILPPSLVGSSKGSLARVGHLGERDAAPTGLEILGRGAYVSLFLSPILPQSPRLGAIQWCRLRRDLPSRSLAPAMGTKGGGKATAILNHLT